MKPVTLYGTDLCPYCVRAEHLLTRKGIVFEKINIGTAPGKREEMLLKSGGQRSVPQIFVGETHVGGFDDLAELDRQGRLDPLLSAH
ncbi:glutaredoxin 3 [Chitinivorax sp. PXF-14]|uniref:Glutaredoxin n=1 Tax=Burkholderia cepacia TaxID=292 RepID=A0A8I1DKZ9_BURCE|nr:MULTISPECIES: glutaredoxin 3 [Burkholderiaceae]MBB0025147.1 glutaredoxin 3 [Ralstonia pickettii]MBB0035935.1 glutaredoxin 3 [Ralstonia pickettii]MBB0098475.1 glutaredoxin 3 [Ralstonia pickettii]MBB0108466.1 glutaredoxin 3 [Ralstonia pickettii]MBB0129249.1 glutaredoxin 3 [Ralstonia pickettii]